VSSFDIAIQALNAPAFTLWGAPVSWAEVLGDLSGAACVWLVARQNIWNWPLGLLNNIFWAVLFWRALLYADAILQGAFFALSVYGWWTWVRGTGAAKVLRVRRTSGREWFVLTAITLLATLAVSMLLARHTRSPAPLWDASVLTLSLAATYGQAQKLVESWWLWIAVDVISVPLYVSRALYPTAALYIVFGCICVKGLVDWSRDLRQSEGRNP
jgi:nicotinamide mononucleotide transporter